MKRALTVFFMFLLLVAFCGCAEYRYGGNYYFPPYPYEYADPYNDYYYYNSYYYSYPYYYRFPPPPLPPEEGGREFRHERREGGEEKEVK